MFTNHTQNTHELYSAVDGGALLRCVRLSCVARYIESWVLTNGRVSFSLAIASSLRTSPAVRFEKQVGIYTKVSR